MAMQHTPLENLQADNDSLKAQIEALQREREKAKNDATAYRKLSEQWNATDLELSQLKALVRALPVYEADALITVDGDLDEIDRPALRSAVMELLEYRATLPATPTERRKG